MVRENVESGKGVEGKKGQPCGVEGGKIVVGDVVCKGVMVTGTEKNGGEVTRMVRVKEKVVAPLIRSSRWCTKVVGATCYEGV